jgi:hypothetical protein
MLVHVFSVCPWYTNVLSWRTMHLNQPLCSLWMSPPVSQLTCQEWSQMGHSHLLMYFVLIEHAMVLLVQMVCLVTVSSWQHVRLFFQSSVGCVGQFQMVKVLIQRYLCGFQPQFSATHFLEWSSSTRKNGSWLVVCYLTILNYNADVCSSLVLCTTMQYTHSPVWRRLLLISPLIRAILVVGSAS